MKQPIPTDGTPLTCDAGTHTVNLAATIDGGFTLYVMAGSTVIDELTDQFTDEQMARHTARRYATALNAGTPIWTLVDERVAADRDLVASINATMDEANTAYLAPRVQARQTADENAGDGQGWTRMRHPNRQVRITRSHVFRRELSKPQISAIRRHEDGIVHLGRGVTGPMLRSMADKGFGELVMRPGTRYTVSHLVLNARGLQVAEEKIGQAA